MEEETSGEIRVSDVDIIITIRSGQTDLKSLQILLKSLLAPLKLNLKDLEIVLTEQIVTIRSSNGIRLSSVVSTYRIE